MTELGFLLDLLLNHQLAKKTRAAITERIKEVEARLSAAPPAPFRIAAAPPPAQAFQLPPGMAPQSASTMAAMARQAANGHQVAPEPALAEAAAPPPEPTQPAVIAQTPAAMAALQARQAAIAAGTSGRPEPGRRSPRKF